MNARSVAKYLIHPFPADAISCGDGRDSLATMIRRDDLPRIISRQLPHTPCRLGCQVIRRLYSLDGAVTVMRRVAVLVEAPAAFWTLRPIV